MKKETVLKKKKRKIGTCGKKVYIFKCLGTFVGNLFIPALSFLFLINYHQLHCFAPFVNTLMDNNVNLLLVKSLVHLVSKEGLKLEITTLKKHCKTFCSVS